MQPRSDEAISLSLSVAIQPSASGRQLVRHTKPTEPFIYLGDTAWELFHRLNDAEAELYLRNRADKGFNSVMVVLMAEHGGLDYPNREGFWPFTPAPESTPEKYIPDITKPDPGYYAFVDRVVALAAALGITISLVPTWGRYVNGGFYGGPYLFDETNAHGFGRFLGERYPFHPFILGGDSVRYWHPDATKSNEIGGNAASLTPIDYGAITEAFASGIIEGEATARGRLSKDLQTRAEGYTTFMTYHSAQVWLPQAPPALASAQFPDAEWLSMDCVQSGHYDTLWEAKEVNGEASAQLGSGDMNLWKGSSAYVPIRKMYNTMSPSGKPRPVIDLEPHYDATHHFFTYSKPLWTGDDIRCGAWQAIFNGACGYTYGVNSIWQMHRGSSKTHPPINPPTTAYTDWDLELDLPGAFYAANLRRILLSLPHVDTRTPDTTFIMSPTSDPDAELGDGVVSGMRAEQWAMVHLPYGGEVEVDVRKALGTSSPYRAWWLDPKSEAPHMVVLTPIGYSY